MLSRIACMIIVALADLLRSAGAPPSAARVYMHALDASDGSELGRNTDNWIWNVDRVRAVA